MRGQAPTVWIVMFFILGAIIFGMWTQGVPTETIELFNEFISFTSNIQEQGTKCELAAYKGKSLNDFQTGLSKFSDSPSQYPAQILDLYKGMNVCFKGAISAKLPDKEVSAKQVLIAGAQGYLGGTVLSRGNAAQYIKLTDEFSNLLTKEELKSDFSSRYDEAKTILACDKTLNEVQALILDQNPLQLALSRVLYEESVASCSIIMGEDMAKLISQLNLVRGVLNDADKKTYYTHLCDMAQDVVHGPAAKSLIKGAEQQGARLICEDWEYIT